MYDFDYHEISIRECVPAGYEAGTFLKLFKILMDF